MGLADFSEVAADGSKGVLSIPGTGARIDPSTGLTLGTDSEVDLNLITSQDAMPLQDAARGMLDIPDVFTVIGHGPNLSMHLADRYQMLTRAERWNLISQNSDDRPVMLLSCRTGLLETSEGILWAEKLSGDLGKPVMAATSQTWWSRKGDVITARSYWSTNGIGRASTGGTIDLGGLWLLSASSRQSDSRNTGQFPCKLGACGGL